MREGKRSVGNEEKFNVEIDRKFILVLRTQDKKTTFYFSYSRANSTFNSSLIYKLIPYTAQRSLLIRVSGKEGGEGDIERRMNENGGEGSFEKKLWKKRSEEGKSA